MGWVISMHMIIDKHYVQQQYLPDELTDSVFYEPSTMGYESKVQEHMKWLKEEK